jgi:hypothetical protein
VLGGIGGRGQCCEEGGLGVFGFFKMRREEQPANGMGGSSGEVSVNVWGSADACLVCVRDEEEKEGKSGHTLERNVCRV